MLILGFVLVTGPVIVKKNNWVSFYNFCGIKEVSFTLEDSSREQISASPLQLVLHHQSQNNTCLFFYFSPLFWRTNFGIQLLVHFLSCVFLFIASCSTCCPPKRLTLLCFPCFPFIDLAYLFFQNKFNVYPFSPDPLFAMVQCFPLSRFTLLSG